VFAPKPNRPKAFKRSLQLFKPTAKVLIAFKLPLLIFLPTIGSPAIGRLGKTARGKEQTTNIVEVGNSKFRTQV
jgi:hypothetical protein